MNIPGLQADYLPRQFKERKTMWPKAWISTIRGRFVDKMHRWLEDHKQKQHDELVSRILQRMKSCGQGIHIQAPFHLSGEKQIQLGNNIHIGTNAFIRGDGGLTIGDNTIISRNLVLYTTNHRYQGARLPYDEEYVLKPVVIGKNVWIGMNVCIAPGTIIGDGVIIGMGTTVSGIVPPLSIIGSQKWRVLSTRDAHHYSQLDDARAFGNSLGHPITPCE